MATLNKKLPKAGNSDELERLEKELADVTRLKDAILADKKKVECERDDLKAEVLSLKSSNEEAVKKILALEAGGKESVIPAGYVQIASCPLAGKRPPEIKLNGIQVPRKVDEDGIVYEIVPIKNAIRLMSDGSAYKRYLIGPCEKIEGVIPNGVYTKKVEFLLHKKRRDNQGGYEFIRVEIEESK